MALSGQGIYLHVGGTLPIKCDSGLLLVDKRVTQIFLFVIVFLFRPSMLVFSGGILSMVTYRPVDMACLEY